MVYALFWKRNGSLFLDYQPTISSRIGRPFSMPIVAWHKHDEVRIAIEREADLDDGALVWRPLSDYKP